MTPIGETTKLANSPPSSGGGYTAKTPSRRVFSHNIGGSVAFSAIDLPDLTQQSHIVTRGLSATEVEAPGAAYDCRRRAASRSSADLARRLNRRPDGHSAGACQATGDIAQAPPVIRGNSPTKTQGAHDSVRLREGGIYRRGNLRQEPSPFAVIEVADVAVKALQEAHVEVIHGNAAQSETLSIPYYCHPRGV
jgi:hypothetical protein